jgi:hypothetical protein
MTCEVSHDYYHTYGDEAIDKLCGALHVGYDAVQAYYGGAPLATRQLFAALALRRKYKCHFRTTFISIKDLDRALRPLYEYQHRAETPDSASTAAPPSSVSASLDPRHDDLGAAGEATSGTAGAVGADRTSETIDLGFLNGLKDAGEEFLVPTSLFVRRSMRIIFRLFRADAGRGRSLLRAGLPRRREVGPGSPASRAGDARRSRTCHWNWADVGGQS